MSPSSIDYGLSIHKLPWWASKPTKNISPHEMRNQLHADKATLPTAAGNATSSPEKQKRVSTASGVAQNILPQQTGPSPRPSLQQDLPIYVDGTLVPIQPRMVTPPQAGAKEKQPVIVDLTKPRSSEEKQLSNATKQRQASPTKKFMLDQGVLAFVNALSMTPGVVTLTEKQRTAVVRVLSHFVQTYARSEEMSVLEKLGRGDRMSLAFEFVCGHLPQSRVGLFHRLMNGKLSNKHCFVREVESSFKQFVQMQKTEDYR